MSRLIRLTKPKKMNNEKLINDQYKSILIFIIVSDISINININIIWSFDLDGIIDGPLVGVFILGT